MTLVFSEIYCRWISDSNITLKSDMISWIEEEHELHQRKDLPSKIFAVSKMFTLTDYLGKMIQFSEAKLATNFDVAATSIHAERFPGLVY